MFIVWWVGIGLMAMALPAILKPIDGGPVTEAGLIRMCWFTVFMAMLVGLAALLWQAAS